MKLGYLTFALLALSVAALSQDLPKPQIRLVAVTDASSNGYAVRSYEIEVVNRADFPNDLFQESPALPPCGKNPNAARTWINIYNERSGRIYGWCAIKENGELASLRFNLPESAPQPKKLFLDLVDRFEGRVLRSNKVDVSQK